MEKIYAGPRLAEVRQGLGLTQTALAKALGVSLSYLNQMERGHRPVSREVAAGLTEQFGVDVGLFTRDEADRLAADLAEALADPALRDAPTGVAERRMVAANAPRFAHAFLSLHRAYARAQERLASLDEALDRPSSTPWPWEEVRDFFHYCDNYIDAIDKAAERFAGSVGFTGPGRLDRAAAWLAETHGVETRLDGTELRRFDGQVLALSAQTATATQAFQMAHQVALIAHDGLLEATLDLARFQTEEARSIAKSPIQKFMRYDSRLRGVGS